MMLESNFKVKRLVGKSIRDEVKADSFANIGYYIIVAPRNQLEHVHFTKTCSSSPFCELQIRNVKSVQIPLEDRT